MKKIIIVFIVITVILCLFGLTFGYLMSENPYRHTMQNKPYETSLDLNEFLSRENALKDLNYVKDVIKSRHQSARLGLPKAFLDAYNEAKQMLPDSPKVIDVFRSISVMLNTLNDAHSNLGMIYDDLKILPNQIDVSIEGDVYIDIDNAFYKIITIHDIEIDVLYKAAQKMISYENIYWLSHRLSQRLRYAAFLYVLGTPLNLDTFEFSYLDGDDVIYQSIAYVDANQFYDPKPSYQSHLFKDDNYAIFELNEMTYDDLYKTFLYNFFKDVKSLNIDHIIIDLRENGGGDSMCAHAFLKYINQSTYKDFGSQTRYRFFNYIFQPKYIKNDVHTDFAFDGKLYVLTSKKTFSSASLFTTILYDNDLATVIGEPMGNAPSAFGDVLSYQTPHTKFYLSTTFKYFMRPDTSNKELTIIPHILTHSNDALHHTIEYISND